MHVSHDFTAIKTCPSYEFLVVFGQVRVWDQKSAGRVRVGMVCGAGADNVSQTSTGAGQGGFKFCWWGAGADKNFNLRRTLVSMLCMFLLISLAQMSYPGGQHGCISSSCPCVWWLTLLHKAKNAFCLNRRIAWNLLSLHCFPERVCWFRRRCPRHKKTIHRQNISKLLRSKHKKCSSDRSHRKHSANYQLNVKLKPNVTVKFDALSSYLGICLDRSLSFRTHLHILKKKTLLLVALIKQLASVGWGDSFKALRTFCLALAFALAEYCAPVWCHSAHTKHIDVPLNESMRIVTGFLQSTPTPFLPILSSITPLETRHSSSCLKLYTKALNPKHLHKTLYLGLLLNISTPENLFAPLWKCCQLMGNQQHQSLQLSNPSFAHLAHKYQAATYPEMP